MSPWGKSQQFRPLREAWHEAVRRCEQTGADVTELHIRSPQGDPADLTLSPWPFGSDRVKVFCEGRRLRGRFTDEPALHDALRAAERAPIRAVFRPE